MILARRSFITGLASLLAAPAVIKADLLMKVGNIDHLLYPVRGLIVYNISTDELVVRIDRANFPLNIPKVGNSVEHILSDKEINLLFRKDEIAMLMPTSKSERQQKYMDRPFSTQEWVTKGLLPPVGNYSNIWV